METCLACSLTDGTLDLPGGRIYATNHWVVEHCIGPLGVGTLIVKPFRHCLHVWQLTDEESQELGSLLRLVSAAIQAILKPDQVYVCLWSHAGWEPGHLHFVLQPSWNDFRREHERPGPFLQVDMFKAEVEPARQEVEAFAARAREAIGELVLSGAGTDEVRFALDNKKEVTGMSVKEIEDAITRLSPEELVELSTWLADYQAKVWDEKIERDLEAGRLDALLEKVDAEYEAGEAKPL